MKKALLLLVPLAAVLAILLLMRSQPDAVQGVEAYVSTDTPLYRSPEDAEAFAVLPAGARVLWLSTTEDYAFGYIEAEVAGKTVRAYAPWLRLNIPNDGTEAAQAMAYLRTEVGWTEEDITEYGMHVPGYYMRYQFVNVEVRSKIHPDWVYYIWLDKLNGGLHDIQSPFTGAIPVQDEKAIRAMLRSGVFTSAAEVQAYFLSCYGPEDSWSAPLKGWAAAEMAGYPQ